MLGASCSLELSKRVLTEQRNPGETEDGTAFRLIQGIIQIWCLKGISEDGIQALFQSQPWPGQEKNNPHNSVPGESGLMMTPYQ